MAKVRAPSIDVLLASGQISPEDIGQYQSYDTNYDNTVNPASTSEKSTIHDLGFQLTPEGTFGGLDPTNVFGAYQGNLRGLADQLAASRAASIARGLRGKGLGAAKERYLRMATDAQNFGLVNQAQNAISGFNTLKAGAESTRTSGKTNYGNYLLGKYLIDAPDDTTPPGGPPGGPPGPPPAAYAPPAEGNKLGPGPVLDSAYAPPYVPPTAVVAPLNPNLIGPDTGRVLKKGQVL